MLTRSLQETHQELTCPWCQRPIAVIGHRFELRHSSPACVEYVAELEKMQIAYLPAVEGDSLPAG